MADLRDQRLEALELKLMEFEVAQNELDAVVIRQSRHIDRLQEDLQTVLGRLDALGAASRGTDAGHDEPGVPLHEPPPHY